MPSPPSLHVDVLVNGVSICTTKSICTVADTPSAAVFAAGTYIAPGSFVKVVSTDADAASDAAGLFVLRPFLGPWERRNNTTVQNTQDVAIDASKNAPPEFASQPMAISKQNVSGAQTLWSFTTIVGYVPVSLIVGSPGA